MVNPRWAKRGRNLLVCALMLPVLAGCTVTPLRLGMTHAEVLLRMGTPNAVVALNHGATRLQYSGQPAGQYATMVDLDASGHVLQLRQVMQATEFARIVAGQWTRADVEREFGPPASIDHVANWPTDILTYRWHEVQDMFFWVYLDQHNVVRRTEQGVEYHHDD